MTKKKIFIIEDDRIIVDELKKIFYSRGFDVIAIDEFTNDPELIKIPKADLIILDINLPGASGYEILSYIKENLTIPVLVLTSRDKLDDELLSFDLGADEFLTKPVMSHRLLARANKLLNIYEKFSDEEKIKDLILETTTNKLTYKNTFIILSQTESDLLKALIIAYPKTLTKDELLESGWNTIYIDENILQVNINRLRKKLKTIGIDNFIITVRGLGYRLDAEKLWNIVFWKILQNQ